MDMVKRMMVVQVKQGAQVFMTIIQTKPMAMAISAEQTTKILVYFTSSTASVSRFSDSI